MEGYVRETKFDEDYKAYWALKDRDKETIGLIQMEFGEYTRMAINSTGVRVNLETKELEFSYEQLPGEPQGPNDVDIIKSKVDNLNGQNAYLLLDSAKKEIQMSDINTNLANITLEVAKLKVGE